MVNRSRRVSSPRTLHGTDLLLALVLALTVTSATVWIFGRPVALGDLLVIPVLVIMLLSPSRGTLPPSYTILVVAYLLWAVLSIGWSANPLSGLGVAQYVEFFFLIPLLFVRVRNQRGLIFTLDAFILASGVLSAGVLFYAISTQTFSQVYFLDYQKNHLGAVVGNAVMLAMGRLVLARGHNLWLVMALLVNCAALLLSGSRGTMLGVAVGSIVFLALLRRVRYAVILAAFATALVWLYFQIIPEESIESLTDFSADSSAGSRWQIYDHAVRFISLSPWVGQGVGSYEISIPAIGFYQQDPSNLFLLNLAEVGVIGLILFVLVLLAIAAQVARNFRAFRSRKSASILSATISAAFAAHLVHAQVDVSWVRGTGTFAFAMVGMMFALRNLPDQEDLVVDPLSSKSGLLGTARRI